MAALQEQQMVTAIAAQFNAQRAEILAHLDTTHIGKSYTRKDWLNDLLDWAAANDNFRDAIKPIVHATLLEAGTSAMQEVGLEASQFDPFTPAIIDYFQNRSQKIAKDVNDETEKQLRAALSKGVQDGKSSFELRAVVEDVMGSASTMRADRIARTEVSRAQGYGDIQAWTQSGVVSGKEWFTAEDEHVCPFCDELDGKTWGLDENIFDKGDSMQVGDQKLDLSYDDVPSNPLHPQCRCTILPVRD
jgi:SPP1 gp7 family putative phage head morphogenesis protein